MAIVGIGMCAVIGYMPTYLQMVYGKSAAVSCLLLFPMTAHAPDSWFWVREAAREFPGAPVEPLVRFVRVPLWRSITFVKGEA
jgi:hypothetical protein